MEVDNKPAGGLLILTSRNTPPATFELIYKIRKCTLFGIDRRKFFCVNPITFLKILTAPGPKPAHMASVSPE